jgi:hypothetical protein
MRESRFKHHLYTSLVGLLPIPDKILDEKLSSINIFFILGTGRSGTKWLSAVLNGVEDSYIVHEPIPLETIAHLQAVKDMKAARNYIHSVRRKHLYLNILLKKFSNYGEVNGALRRHIPYLQEAFPQAKFLHVIRDGRKVVNSIMARGTYGGKHPVYGQECPIPDSNLQQKWFELTEFEKTCWVWKQEVNNLDSLIVETAKLENITTSYSAFRSELLDPLSIDLPEDQWEKYSSLKINATTNSNASDMDWSPDQVHIFKDICGEEMERYGYY